MSLQPDIQRAVLDLHRAGRTEHARHVIASYGLASIADASNHPFAEDLLRDLLGGHAPAHAQAPVTNPAPPSALSAHHSHQSRVVATLAGRRVAVFDTELIGKNRPVFLFCAKIIDTGEKIALWGHRPGDMLKMKAFVERKDLTLVGFNSAAFDIPIVSLAAHGATGTSTLSCSQLKDMKSMADMIINADMRPWQLRDRFIYRELAIDHFDLCDVAPGVKISLKAYAARMGYKTLRDLPFDHNYEITTREDAALLLSYCWNDVGVTCELLARLTTEIGLRYELSSEHGIDLRSKSDAQIAEAVLKKAIGIKGRVSNRVPLAVNYRAPDFISTDSEIISGVMLKMSRVPFKIKRDTGNPIAPAWMSEPVRLGHGSYKIGLGGLHSTHDVSVMHEANDEWLISDFDVASYYPNIMLKAGLIPRFGGDQEKGRLFIEEYRKIYTRRIDAKRSGDKKIANSLKITLNGTFGKLGSMYSAFYSPDLMLAVTLSGQLNLLCLIHELEKIPDVFIESANTDGILVRYKKTSRNGVLDTIKANESRTGFEYEETPYKRIALKDVNNYIALTTDGKIKAKGLYAPSGLQKNPTAEVCSKLIADAMRENIMPEDAISRYTDPEDYMSVRSVAGGGVQPDSSALIDDWVLVEDNGSAKNRWARKAWIDENPDEHRTVTRKSRPAPVECYFGGEPFGRIARWYMTRQPTQPITYVKNGAKVPKTEGARLCLDLPAEIPSDLDRAWYVAEARSMLRDIGYLKS